MMACWNCGAEPRWVCRRCGSTERRKTGSGCAECHRTASRQQAAARRPPADDSDIVITSAMRAYLAAFDAWLLEPSRSNRSVRAGALEYLENDRG